VNQARRLLFPEQGIHGGGERESHQRQGERRHTSGDRTPEAGELRTDGGKEFVDALVSIARGVMPNIPVEEGSRPKKDQQVRPADPLKAIEILLNRGFGRSPQQLDIAHSVCDSPLEHLSDETLRFLVEKARQLKEGGGVLVDGDGQIVTE